MKQKIVFFGSGSYTIPIIEKLIPHGLSLVITTEKTGPITDFCKKKGIEITSDSSASQLSTFNFQLSTHSLGVLASYGAIIPDEIINAFKYGIINIHPSLLPRWKGPSPIQYTLLNGDTQSGVTLIKLDNEVDHGNILAQTTYKLNGTETTQFLLDKLFSIGAEMVEKLVIKLEKNQTLDETPQDHSKETWSYKIAKQDGFIDINNLKATTCKLQAMIRAFYPWPRVWFRYDKIAASPTAPRNDKESHSKRSEESIPSNVIAGSEMTKQSSSSSVIASKAKQSSLNNKIIKLLPEEMIQVEGKNQMSCKDFINGYGDEGVALLEKLNLN